jgi:yeast amino acid transporter
VNIPLFIALYAFWKFYKKTKIWKPAEMDFVTGIPTIEETEHEIPPPTSFLGKIAEKVF